LLVAILIALIPIIAFEDYFVENLYYHENPLLVGSPDKIQHMKIVQSYFGRIRQGFFKTAIPWKRLRNLVNGFFTKDIVGTKIGFYGINGFCLFSYFVKEKTTFRWFPIAILFSNLLCVAIIIICYIIITISAFNVSQSVSKNPQTENNNNNHDGYLDMAALHSRVYHQLRRLGRYLKLVLSFLCNLSSHQRHH
jgi:amino acid transporter